MGNSLDRIWAGDRYSTLLRAQWADFQTANLSRDPAITDAWWRELTLRWMNEVEIPESQLEGLIAVANELLFGPESEVFKLYDDTQPALAELVERGYVLAVVSNWDVSLHRVLRMFDLEKYFKVRIASLEHGVEKPDPEIFHIALRQLGASPSETIHIGDNPLDDFEGAMRAGLRSVLLDRRSAAPSENCISSLLDLKNLI